MALGRDIRYADSIQQAIFLIFLSEVDDVEVLAAAAIKLTKHLELFKQKDKGSPQKMYGK